MKIITLWQPWASFIALGWKTIETRTHDRFRNLVGETIGIHAGNFWDKDWKELAAPWMTQIQIDEVSLIRNAFELGHGKGEILLTARVNANHSRQALINCPYGYGTDRFGLFLNNVRQITPIPTNGKQGIWHYDVD